MATELILISSSPPPQDHGLTTPLKAPPAIGVPSTSSPAPAEELVISRHFRSSRTVTSTRSKIATLVTAYESGANTTAVPEGLRLEFAEDVAKPEVGSAQILDEVNSQPIYSAAIAGHASKEKASAIRRKRSKLTATTEAATDASKTVVPTGSHWRANKRSAQRKPDDDGDSLLDQSHKLYMMHFQPGLFYSDTTDYGTVIDAVEQARQSLEFVMDDLTADIAEYLSALADVQRVEAEAAKASARQVEFGAPVKPKRKRRSLKDVKDKDIARALRTEGRKQRAAAKKAEVSSVPKARKTTSKCQSEKVGKGAETQELETAQPKACRRKRDWTPPHDSFMDIDDVFKGQDANADGATTSFSGIVQGFAHEDQNTRASIEVTPAATTEKAPKKKGRPQKSDAPPTAAAKPAKTPAKSALPKKPKTVTGMALEAYQPAETETPSDNRISHFFRQVAKDAKKARSRSPVKKVPALSEQPVLTGPDEEATTTPAPKVKLRKSVKIAKEPEVVRPKLLSPAAAARRISDQEFIFGTSSQLVREEDAGGLQDIQQALRESFLSAASPEIESQIVSRTERGIWHVAGEQDVEQELLDDLARSRFIPDQQAKKGRMITPPTGDAGPAEDCLVLPVSSPPVLNEISEENMESRGVSPGNDAIPTTGAECQGIDEATEGALDNVTQLMTPAKSIEDIYTNLSDIITSPLDQQQPEQPIAIVIPSSPDVPLQLLARGSPGRANFAATLSRASPRPRLSLSPPPYRPALRDLSTNTSPRKPRMISPIKLPASTAPPTETPKRPRGGPRKNSIGPVASVPTQTKVDMMPRKSKLKIRRSPSSQANAEGTEAWTNLDDIEDSEPDLMPSPPRGSQTRELPTAIVDDHQTDGITTPATVKTTKTTPAAKRALSPRATKAKAYGLAKKETSEAGWAATAALLFPQIARTIKTSREPADPDGKYVDCGRKTAKRTTKGASASKEASSTVSSTTTSAMPIRLSWYEKILMYDPIVIEDLTDFLIAKGVTVPVSADSVKEKSASKAKAKDAEPMFRTLEPWMVQRWCEDHSICCLWRASLVGGTRARY